MRRLPFLLALACVFPLTQTSRAAEPLHARIDRLVEAAGKGLPASAVVDDAGFLRRVYLDLAGTIPTPATARTFLDSKAADKRVKLVEQILAGTDYPRRMQEA